MSIFDSLTTAELVLAATGAFFAGIAVFLFATSVTSITQRALPEESQGWQFNASRLWKLRNGSRIFRLFEPLIKDLESALARPAVLNSRLLKHVELSLQRGGCSLPFQPLEYLAHIGFQGILAACGATLLATFYVSASTAVVVGLLTIAYVAFVGIRKLTNDSTERLNQIKQRLPFCIDLLALTMQAGAVFTDSLATVVKETSDSPAGHEMAKLKSDTTKGRTLARSLKEMQGRLRDPEIDEFVIAVTNSDRLGTKLSDIFLRLADQVRMKRSQKLEKKAGQAHTMMAFPGFVIMIACLLIAVAPFALAALSGG